MKYFSIKNFEKFQHYKDRNPSWIKLYFETLQDYKFSLLTEKTQLHLIKIWLLASRLENVLPYDPIFIKKQIGARGRVDLKTLEEKGFILPLPEGSRKAPEPFPNRSRTTPEISRKFNGNRMKAGFDENKGVMVKNASKSLAECYQSARPETYKEEADKNIYSVFDFWNRQEIVKHRVFEKFKSCISASLKHFTAGEIIQAIVNYKTVLDGPEYYFSHRWTLQEFLVRKGGLEKFLDQAKPFENFKSNGSGNGRWKTNADKNSACGEVVI